MSPEAVALDEVEASRSVLRTFNSELDRRLGGGLRIPTLALIEGANDTGKSALCYQLCYGALMSGLRTCYITTEQTIRGLLNAMESLSYDVRHYFYSGRLHIHELHVEGLEWAREMSQRLLRVLANYVRLNPWRFDLFIIDSLTYLLTHVKEKDVLDFFTLALNVTSSNVSIIVTLHDYALPQELMIRIRSICDTHIVLSMKEVTGRVCRFMKILKAKGVEKSSDSVIGFEVTPAFGLRITPFSQAII